jgi:hypothetical protein
MFNSFETMQDLVKRKLATAKTQGNLTLFKYAKNVMYGYKWNEHPELLECRGHVYDNQTGQIVQAAPRKSFNYLENGTWANMPINTKVSLYKKLNGFMACATIHNGELLVTTTGSFDSEYVQWAKEEVLKSSEAGYITKGYSVLFEIVVPQDPHIVPEKVGAHLLGWRAKAAGRFVPQHSSIVPLCFNITLAEALEIAEQDRGEGFMMYNESDWSQVCKLKTPYYVGKKKLMRMSPKNVELLYTNDQWAANNLPDMWQSAPYVIPDHFYMQEWIDLPEQNRRKFLEEQYG